MNKIVITDCNDCRCFYPRHHGEPAICLCHCEVKIDKELKSDGKCNYPIPNWCPKLLEQKDRYIITEVIPVDPEIDKMIDKHFSNR